MFDISVVSLIFFKTHRQTKKTKADSIIQRSFLQILHDYDLRRSYIDKFDIL